MINWYLVLYVISSSGGVAVIPVSYSSKQECQKAAEPWGSSFRCIQGPDREDKGYVCQPDASVCQVVK